MTDRGPSGATWFACRLKKTPSNSTLLFCSTGFVAANVIKDTPVSANVCAGSGVINIVCCKKAKYDVIIMFLCVKIDRVQSIYFLGGQIAVAVESEKITNVLIANRGYIAFRIIRAAGDANITSVAVYAEQDANAPF